VDRLPLGAPCFSAPAPSGGRPEEHARARHTIIGAAFCQGAFVMMDAAW
jgi:hypothetical protein